MTYAPSDLLAVQRYAQAKTGQAWASLGIVGDTSHNSSGGYHVGHDVLHALGTAPEDPGSDYSYTESQRDRSGLTDGASAFDLGGNFPRFYEFNAWIVGRARAGDPRCRDTREIIYTPDGRTVRRWDALGIRSSGDSSHLTHTHFSFFRDSEGRRASADNFLGLLQEFFDGGTDMAQEDRDLMAALYDRTVGTSPLWKGTPPTWSLMGLQARLDALTAKVDALAAGVPTQVTMTDADRQAIAAQMPKPPTAAEVAEELAKRLGNG